MGNGNATGAAYQRTFNRFELKYVLPLAEARAFVASLDERLRPDPFAGEAGSYRVRSLYYDSPGLACFWEKIDGLRFRRKLRLRCYGDAPADAACFVEIKQRADRTVQKRRCRLSLKEAYRHLPAPAEDPPQTTPEPPEGCAAVLSEARYLVDHYGLVPQVIVAYRREPFLAVHEGGLRITIDHGLCARVGDLDLLGSLETAPAILPAQLCVLEVKFNDVAPLWLTEHLARFECSLRRLSKYCQAARRLLLAGATV